MRVAIYTRVSTERQELKGHSLDEQERLCHQWVEQREGFSHAQTYSDVGSGGSTERREGYLQMMGDMGEVWDLVVSYKLDRFHRNTYNAIDFVDTIEKASCGIACITEQMDTSTIQGRFFFTVFAALAELRRNEIRERVKMGMTGARLKGIWLGTPPYGYDMNRDVDDLGRRTNRGRLVINEDEAPVIGKIFQWKAEKLSISSIINLLVEHGHRTRKGKLIWHRQTVKNIIQKWPLYAFGAAEIDGEVIHAIHPPILDGANLVEMDEWGNAQATEEE
jgi:site-specific DNA recombinase